MIPTATSSVHYICAGQPRLN